MTYKNNIYVYMIFNPVILLYNTYFGSMYILYFVSGNTYTAVQYIQVNIQHTAIQYILVNIQYTVLQYIQVNIQYTMVQYIQVNIQYSQLYVEKNKRYIFILFVF